MKKIGIVLILVVLFIKINAQTEAVKKIEHGLVLATKIDTDDGFAADYNFASKVKGFGIESGYYLLKPISKKGILSFDFRLAYNQSERKYNNLLIQSGYNILSTTYSTRTGVLKYKGLAFTIPIKYRFKFKETGSFFILGGTSLNFNLWNQSNWKYDEFLWESNLPNITIYNISDVTYTIISEKKDQVERLNQKPFNTNLLLGIGYKKDNMMFELSVGGGGVGFEGESLRGSGRISLILEFYYKLN